MMKKKLLITLTALAAMTCTLQTTIYAEDAKQTITDTMGRTVELNSQISSIMAIPWPWSSFVFALDGDADRICTMSATALASYKNCMFQKLAPGLADADTDFIDDTNKDGGSFGTMNVEEIKKIDPDAVLIYGRDAEKMLPSLEALDIPTIVLGFGGLEEVQEGLSILGEIMGDEAAENADYIINKQKEVEEEIIRISSEITDEKKVKILHLTNSNLGVTTEGFNGKMLKEAGLSNVVSDGTDAANISETANFEQILVWNPDIIIMGNFDSFTPEQIYNNELAGQDWSQIEAVKNKRVYKIPMGIYRWDAPNTEAHLELEWLAKLAYPEEFSTVNLKADTEEFYRELFDYELTEEDFALIYHDDLNSLSADYSLE